MAIRPSQKKNDDADRNAYTGDGDEWQCGHG
jgi:hypothetical protein